MSSIQHPLLDSWGKLLTYHLPNKPEFDGVHRPSAPSAPGSTGTSGYTAKEPPEDAYAPRYYVSEPDDGSGGLKARVLAGLAQGLQRQRAQPLPQLPTEAQSCPPLPHPGANEQRSATYFVIIVFTIIRPIVIRLFEAAGRTNVEVTEETPPLKHSQQGDLNLSVTWEGGKTTVAVEYKSFAVFMKHAGRSELGTTRPLVAAARASGCSAIAIKLCLQMYNASARFGILFSSHAFLLAERFQLPNDAGNILLLSPPLTTFGCDIRVEGANIEDYPSPFRPAPLIALIVALLCQDLEDFKIEKVDAPPGPALSLLERHEEEADDVQPSEHSDDNDPSYNGDSGVSRFGLASRQSEANYDLRGRQRVGNLDSGAPLYIIPVLAELPIWHSYGPANPINHTPRLAHRVQFDLSSTSPLPPVGLDRLVAAPALLTPPLDASGISRNLPTLPPLSLPPSISTPPDSPDSTPAGATPPSLSSDVRAFLEHRPYDIHQFGASLHLPSRTSCDAPHLVLDVVVGTGRTATAWRAKMNDTPVIVKMMDNRWVGSITRESMFYERVLPAFKDLQNLVPRYYGTFVLANGGCYATVLEDCGIAVGNGSDWPDNPELMRKIEAAKKKFRRAGISLNDHRPPNIVQAEDGEIRFIDFGDATLLH